MIKVDHISKSFKGLKAVDDVSFRIKKGEAFGLLGPNGAGKSTAINIISGLFPPNQGDIQIFDHDMVQSPKSAQQHIGVVPQDIALYQSLSAQENLMFWGRMYGLRGATLKTRVDDVLALIGLASRAKDKVDTFSGGMKRRVNIGAAILHNPKILIMDEPTVGIDPQSRNHILETVKELNNQGMTLIYTSHYMEEVQFLCDRIGIMDHGKVIACGNMEELRQTVENISELKLELDLDEEQKEEITQLVTSTIPEVNLFYDQNILRVLHNNPQQKLSQVIQILANQEIPVKSVNIVEPNLETIFLQLTGRSLRD